MGLKNFFDRSEVTKICGARGAAVLELLVRAGLVRPTEYQRWKNGEYFSFVDLATVKFVCMLLELQPTLSETRQKRIAEFVVAQSERGLRYFIGRKLVGDAVTMAAALPRAYEMDDDSAGAVLYLGSFYDEMQRRFCAEAVS